MGRGRRHHGGHRRHRRRRPLLGRRHDAHRIGHRRTQCRRHRELQHSERRLRHLHLRSARHGGRHRHHHQTRPRRREHHQLHRRIHLPHDSVLPGFQHYELAGPDVGVHGHAEKRLAQPRRNHHRFGKRRIRKDVPDDCGRTIAKRRRKHRELPARGGVPQHELVQRAVQQQRHAHPLGEPHVRNRQIVLLCVAERHERPGLDEDQQGGTLHGQHQRLLQHLQKPVAEPDFQRLLPEACRRQPTT